MGEHIRVGSACFDYNQCCGSGMFIPDPNFSIPDTGSRVKKILDQQYSFCMRTSEYGTELTKGPPELVQHFRL
jgi:hypothetical protein